MSKEPDKFPKSPAEGDRDTIDRELKRQSEKGSADDADKHKEGSGAPPRMNEDPHPLDRRNKA